MNIAVCDDNSIEREIIIAVLYEYASIHALHFDITEYSSGINLLYDIQEGQDYNLIFLDIIMDEIIGIDVARKLRAVNNKSNIVFLTVSPDFAISSYDVDATGYLLKPLDPSKAFAVLDKVIASYETKKYPIYKNSAITYISIDKILYVESDNSRCILHHKEDGCYTVYKRLDIIQEELPASHFLRCHKSFLVNMDHIKSADNKFTLVTGDVVAIRQRNLKEIRAKYLEYISKRFHG
jgi:two-component system response regulator LytT